MSEIKHTPTPWFYRQSRPTDNPWIADHPDHGRHTKVIVLKGSAEPADMALIVAAVNAYAPQQALIATLVEALERAAEELRLIRMKDTGAVYDTMLRVDMSAALAKAKEGQP